MEQFEQLKVTAASKDINNDPGIKELIETYSKVGFVLSLLLDEIC